MQAKKQEKVQLEVRGEAVAGRKGEIKQIYGMQQREKQSNQKKRESSVVASAPTPPNVLPSSKKVWFFYTYCQYSVSAPNALNSPPLHKTQLRAAAGTSRKLQTAEWKRQGVGGGGVLGGLSSGFIGPLRKHRISVH